MALNDKMIKLITYYQTHKTSYHIKRCRHIPSCSEYGKQCYQKFNFFKASFLTAKRIMSCNVFSKKVYDPVPLSKEEKAVEKVRQVGIKELKQIILDIYKKYPLMQIEDFIKLIYENNYGYCLNALGDNKINEKLEYIGNDFYRAYIDSDSYYLDYANKKPNQDAIDIVFYEKLEMFLKLVNKKKIKLDKREARDKVYDYLLNGIRPVEHSKIYLENYDSNYVIINKECVKEGNL